MDILKKYLPYLLAFLLGFVAGYFFCQKTTAPVTIEKPPIVKTEYQTQTKTEVVYVPKGEDEKTDIEVNANKPDLNIKVNGKEAVFNKEYNENYLFERNKLVLDQQSKASINIEVPTIDKTKHYGAGPGLSNHGLAGMITYPVIKKANLDGWVYGDRETAATGIILRF
jgi:hypothetical protein